ncbi:MAG: porin family protein [Endomicrobia bacterium]|nr:porin family protein [Endomicrobiia bacterium]MCL2799305.1 porin family protein [Endomicrobiia bacterium]
MKKLVLAVLAVVFTAGAVFAGESFINVKAGVDPAGHWTELGVYNENTEFGISLAAEYLYAASDVFSFGGGFEYVLPREIENWSGTKISYLPIYVTVKLNPVPVAKEVFFKANLGGIVHYDFDQAGSGYEGKNGGLYYALGAGYEFPIGLAVDLTYSWYQGKVESYDQMYRKFGINVGYKFKI